jgi:hypothetical protein
MRTRFGLTLLALVCCGALSACDGTSASPVAAVHRASAPASVNTPHTARLLRAPIRTCRLSDLRVTLGHSGLDATSDFAVFSFSGRDVSACAMRRPIRLRALGASGAPLETSTELISRPASPPLVVLGRRFAVDRSRAVRELGVSILGSNGIGYPSGTCLGRRVEIADAWRVSLGGSSAVVSMVSQRTLVRRLSGCVERGRTFVVSRQKPARRVLS